ncbi:hypothetical protein Pfo_005571 [Paulownia fortunei]|nr:hypothetical protein Pfo_005571 [Paulownia fortunei]
MGRTAKAALVLKFFPGDVLEEILSRIPVQHHTRFKSICKTWLHLISIQYFIQLHLKKSISRPTHLRKLLFIPHTTLDFPKVVLPCAFLIDHQEMLRKEVPLLQESTGFCMDFFGTCDGLVCLYNGESGMIHIWNPSTQISQCIYIKRPPDKIKSYWFGRHQDEYKLVIGTVSHMHLIRPYIGNNSRKSEQEVGKPFYYYEKVGTFLNGAVHWPVQEWSTLHGPFTICYTVLSYDLGRDKFGEISVLELKRKRSDFEGFTLGEIDGCLSAMFIYGLSVELWTMKQYGVKESWTKLMVLHGDPHPNYHPIIHVKDEVVLLHSSVNIPLYDKVPLYVESLVSPRWSDRRAICMP